MKNRDGFVSNSSSSSFVIRKSSLVPIQMEFVSDLCENIGDAWDELGCYETEDWWSGYEDVEEFKFYTTMNNFDLSEALKKRGIHGIES